MSLIEVLLGIVIIAITSIGTLSYFSYGLGGVAKQGNRRAALERAREQLERLTVARLADIQPPIDVSLAPDVQPVFWLTCSSAAPSAPCTWARSAAPPSAATQTSVNGELRRMETTIQWRDDPSAQTPGKPDTMELAVKVWFTPDSAIDDAAHCIQLRTLRTM